MFRIVNLAKAVLMTSLALMAYGCGGSEGDNESAGNQNSSQGDIAQVHYDQTERMNPEQDEGELGAHGKHISKAFCVVNAKGGSEVVGAVTFTEVEGGVRIIADIGGLTPGKHGFHIHEHGDCSAADGSSAGGHFNPTNKKHGGPDSFERHAGDLGNLEANESGFAHYDRVDSIIQLNGEHSIIGKSIIIHADEDDLVSDPTGNAGKRIGCGEIVESDM